MAAALEHLAVQDLVARENGSWQLRVPVQEIEIEPPESLRQMIETQINRLSSAEQRSLGIASVVGPVFSGAVGALSAGMDVQEFETLCEGLSRRHILRSAGPRELPNRGASERYQFVHALYREVLYRRQSPGNRAKLHLQVAERLEELFEHRHCEVATELAHHFGKGGDARRARRYLQLKENLMSA
jgi:predicted ATPase